VHAAEDALPISAARTAASDLVAARMLDYALPDGRSATADVLEFRTSEGARRVYAIFKVGFALSEDASSVVPGRARASSARVTAAVSNRRVSLATGFATDVLTRVTEILAPP
jgi:hypothetical protein